MLRHELFKKLTKINKDDRILLLTHDDADGAGAELDITGKKQNI